jgi:hypothetical protein
MRVVTDHRVTGRVALTAAAIAASLAAGGLLMPAAAEDPTVVEPVEVSPSCPQATGCDPKVGFICSTKNGDKIDEICTDGCGGQEM